MVKAAAVFNLGNGGLKASFRLTVMVGIKTLNCR